MLYDQVNEAVSFLNRATACRPKTAVILGSGLGSLAEDLPDRQVISYSSIPHFPHSSIAGHSYQLVFGTVGHNQVVFMQGRFHYYEGYTMQQLTFPVYVLKMFGVENLVITNACGAINSNFTPGDLMLITDHVNLLGLNPLIGENDERFGPRFPDMSEVYTVALQQKARETAKELSIDLKEGVYGYFNGPCYETAAEIRAYKTLGCDTVGMSTVPEATVACYLGMKVLAVGCITNMATGLSATKHSHQEVLAIANASSARLCCLMERLLQDL